MNHAQFTRFYEDDNRNVFHFGLWLFVTFFTFLMASQAHAMLRPESFTALAEAAGPGVVNIRTEKTTPQGERVFKHFFPAPFGDKDPFEEFFRHFQGEGQQKGFKQQSLGSGFLMDADGYIVTNNHVIDGADTIRVKLKNGEEYDAEIVGKDPSTDLALIRIQTDAPLPFIPMGDSDALKIGEWVMAIGSPFGLEQTVTAGIVSAKGRVIDSGAYRDFIQTDASINPGNSGGPLINLKGEVIGINTAIIASGQGIGFAIPVNLARRIVEQLKSKGEVVRGWLGVSIQSLEKDMAEYLGVPDGKGVYVAKVIAGEPAEKAGIKDGDVIIAINGTPIAETKALTRMIADTQVGEKVRVTLIRDGKKKNIKVKIGQRDEAHLQASGSPKPAAAFGMQLAAVSPEMADRLGVSEGSGVLVTAVKPDSAAAKAGVRQGDLILEVNHKKVGSLSAYHKTVDRIAKGDDVQFFVQRRNRFVVISLVK